MLRDVPESDWKLFRRLQGLALERFCEQVLGETKRIAADSSKTSHQRFLDLYGYVHQRDRVLADMFDNPRRSTALIQLMQIVGAGLLTDEELEGFSSETRAMIRFLSNDESE